MKFETKHLSSKLYLVIFLLFISLYACKKDSNTDSSNTDMGYDYYPIALGSWYIYSVDSTVHDDFTDSVYTLSYQIKEIYADTFTDNEGRLSYKIGRYKRDSDSSQWTISDIWYVTKTTNHIERIEEDVRYEPFIFPPQNETEWNLNSFNNYNVYTVWERHQTWQETAVEIEVKDTLVDKTFVLDTITSYEHTVTIWHDYQTYISDEQYHAVYAKNIGLVYKQMIYYYSDDTTDVPFLERITYGVSYTQKLISYG